MSIPFGNSFILFRNTLLLNLYKQLTSSYKSYHMQKKAGALLYYCCLGMAGFVFAICCFVIYISGLILDLLAFVGLLGVAFGSLVYGRVKRAKLYFPRLRPTH